MKNFSLQEDQISKFIAENFFDNPSMHTQIESVIKSTIVKK